MEKKMMLMSPSDIRAIIQMASEIDGDTTQKVQDLENITEAAERALVKRRTHTPVQTHALDETKYRKEMDTILNHLRIIDSPSNQDPKIRGYSGVIDAEGF